MKLYTLDGQFIRETNLNTPHNFTGMIEYTLGTKIWYVDGKLHRLDGPAIDEWCDGHKTWCVHGVKCSKEQHALLIHIMRLKGLL